MSQNNITESPSLEQDENQMINQKKWVKNEHSDHHGKIDINGKMTWSDHLTRMRVGYCLKLVSGMWVKWPNLRWVVSEMSKNHQKGEIDVMMMMLPNPILMPISFIPSLLNALSRSLHSPLPCLSFPVTNMHSFRPSKQVSERCPHHKCNQLPTQSSMIRYLDKLALSQDLQLTSVENLILCNLSAGNPNSDCYPWLYLTKRVPLLTSVMSFPNDMVSGVCKCGK